MSKYSSLLLCACAGVAAALATPHARAAYYTYAAVPYYTAPYYTMVEQYEVQSAPVYSTTYSNVTCPAIVIPNCDSNSVLVSVAPDANGCATSPQCRPLSALQPVNMIRVYQSVPVTTYTLY